MDFCWPGFRRWFVSRIIRSSGNERACWVCWSATFSSVSSNRSCLSRICVSWFWRSTFCKSESNWSVVCHDMYMYAPVCQLVLDCYHYLKLIAQLFDKPQIYLYRLGQRHSEDALNIGGSMYRCSIYESTYISKRQTKRSSHIQHTASNCRIETYGGLSKFHNAKIEQ